jgi:hypothetical protein
VSAAPPGRWISVAAAAKLAGVSPKTMRRHLVALNRLHDGRLLRSFGDPVRKYFVNPRLLERDLALKTTDVRDELDTLRSQVAVLGRKVEALLRANRALRLRVDSVRAF